MIEGGIKPAEETTLIFVMLAEVGLSSVAHNAGVRINATRQKAPLPKRW